MTDAPPFSRWVKVDALPADGLTQTVEASSDERAALAALNGLAAIASLKANFTVRRSGRGGARVTGEVHADVTQVCVVSLEPFAAIVDEPVDVRFAPAEAAETRAAGERRRGGDGRDRRRGSADPIVDGKSISARWRPSSLRSASILIPANLALHSIRPSRRPARICPSPRSPSRRRNADALLCGRGGWPRSTSAPAEVVAVQ